MEDLHRSVNDVDGGMDYGSEEAGLLSSSSMDDLGSSREVKTTLKKVFKGITHAPGTVEDVFVYKQERILRKSRVVYLKNYYKILVLLGIFYALPSAQFVYFQYKHSDEGTCYYNFKCERSFMGLRAFNNILSNIGYVVFGVAFGLFVYIARWRNKTEEHGLHKDRSLYYCISLAIVWEGFFSGLYHVCPSKVNFQFDTTFMLIGTGLMFITVFQKRHPTTAPGAMRAFVFFALLIFISFLALSDIYVELVWIFTFVVLIGAGLLGNIHFYYHKRIPFKTFIYNVTHPWPLTEPGRLLAILMMNSLSLAALIYAAIDSIRDDDSQSVPHFMLGIVMINAFLYMAYYGVMKLIHREKVHLYVWILIALSALAWGSALYFFLQDTTDKFLTPEESRKLNKPCILFDYFDTHDVWHFLSGVGLFTVAMLCYVLDFGLEDKHRALPLF